MRILVIDNYDSFTNNLVHYLQQVDSGIDVHVAYNDAYDFLGTRLFQSFDAIVITPGPGNVTESKDIGICHRILSGDERPIFGVCLGHQAIGRFAGAQVVRAPEPVHGRVWNIFHTNKSLFSRLDQPFAATRYHSWVVAPALSDDLRLLAWAEGNAAVMGLEHRTKPQWGVQFHPEAIGTTVGMQIMRNFVHLARLSTIASTTARARKGCVLHWRRIGRALDPASVAQAAMREGAEPLVLESAMILEGVSRFSYVSVQIGAGDRTLSYWQDRKITVVCHEDGSTERHERSIFEFLEEIEHGVETSCGSPPFAFKGGAIGWLGYELKSECNPKVTSRHLPEYPSAVFRLSHSFLVVDHVEDATYVAVCTTPATVARRDEILTALIMIARQASAAVSVVTSSSSGARTALHARHSDLEYLSLIEQCQQEIENGESYELCLTNCLDGKTQVDPWEFYLGLRRRNPAAYAAYVAIGGVTVASSSPEGFLKIDDAGRIVAKPIKGTIGRGKTEREDVELRERLRQDKKERAENMMIVDLLRHDLSTVSKVGTVRVSKLFDIETLPTVHQMVSTIEGRLRPTLCAVDAIKACFPGGSMTGAPKVRSMEILDRLEDGPRGVYSGALGWIGFDGQLDLSIVIRTAVFHKGTISIGCGGAVTYLSEPESELAEMKLKSHALSQALFQTEGTMAA